MPVAWIERIYSEIERAIGLHFRKHIYGGARFPFAHITHSKHIENAKTKTILCMAQHCVTVGNTAFISTFSTVCPCLLFLVSLFVRKTLCGGVFVVGAFQNIIFPVFSLLLLRVTIDVGTYE